MTARDPRAVKLTAYAFDVTEDEIMSRPATFTESLYALGYAVDEFMAALRTAITGSRASQLATWLVYRLAGLLGGWK